MGLSPPYLDPSPAVLLNEGLDKTPGRLLVLDVTQHRKQAFSFTNLHHKLVLKEVKSFVSNNLHDAIVGRDVKMVRIRYVRIRLLKIQLSNANDWYINSTIEERDVRQPTVSTSTL